MHEQFMRQALALGEQARFHAPPNPWVGCVIVKEDRVIGQGYTLPPGQAHAEINALEQAQEHARGAALYATLEPCSHYGRTPPCVDAIIQAGIKTVYVAQQDPDPRVKGRGIERLQEAGIHVLTGVCEQEARTFLAPYLYQRQTGLPYTTLKAAISIDGRTAASDGSSQWITSPEARQDAHFQRALSQAIIVGSGTALADKPQLTVRNPSIHLPRQPLRVILDTRGRISPEGPLFDQKLAPTLILTTSFTPAARLQEWEAKGIEVSVLPAGVDGRIDLEAAWALLGKRGILQVLVEGGSSLQSALLKTSLVNCLSLYMGPLLLGTSGLPLFLEAVPALKEAHRLRLKAVKQIDDCLRIDYEPLKEAGGGYST